MGSSNQAKEALWEKKDLLEQHDGNLQEKKFRNHVFEVIKTSKTTIEALSAGGSRRESFPEVSRVGESWGQSDSPHQRIQLSKQQTKMAATKLQFESKRKIPTF